MNDNWWNDSYLNKSTPEYSANYIQLLIKMYSEEVFYEIAYGLPRLERETIEIKELP